MVRRSLLGLFGILMITGLGVLVGGVVRAQPVAQGFGADTQIGPGIIVRLKSTDASKVAPLTPADISKMYGVVVDANAAPATLSDGATGSQVYVAVGGTYEVVVSDQNGTIHTGDYITISSLEGTGMKADNQASLILGKAGGNFDGKSDVQSTTTLKDANGGHHNVAVGRIPVEIAIGRNPLLQNTQPNLPEFLIRASQSIADKPVSTARVYLGLIILLVSALIAGSLLYGGVRSGFIAIGRNPLAKKSIIRSLVQVTLTSLIVFIIGLFAVYLLLKL